MKKLPHRAEGEFVDEGAQVVLIGELERTVIVVEPRYGKFQPPPRIEAGGPCVGLSRPLGSGRGGLHLGPFSFEEGEAAHRSFFPFRSSVLRVTLPPFARLQLPLL